MPAQHALSWQDAEYLAATHMRRLGFLDAKVTGPGTDGGIDVVSQYAVAQVKHRQTKAGRPAVQRLHGAAVSEGRRGIVYSSGGFARPAVEFADRNGIALFVFDADLVVQPTSAVAYELEAKARNRVRPPSTSPARTVPAPRPQAPVPVAVPVYVIQRAPDQPRNRLRHLMIDGGRWYFTIVILSAGILAAVPFLHAASKLRTPRLYRLAGAFGGIAPVLVVLAALSRRGRVAVEPWSSISAVVGLGVISAACLLLAPVRRLVFRVGGWDR